VPTRQAVFVRGVSVVDVWLICYYYPASSGVGDGGPARQAVCARGISVTTGGYTMLIPSKFEAIGKRCTGETKDNRNSFLRDSLESSC
jgi:hypothetical protein